MFKFVSLSDEMVCSCFFHVSERNEKEFVWVYYPEENPRVKRKKLVVSWILLWFTHIYLDEMGKVY